MGACSPSWTVRRRSISRSGGDPRSRPYSRLTEMDFHSPLADSQIRRRKGERSKNIAVSTESARVPSQDAEDRRDLLGASQTKKKIGRSGISLKKD